MDNFADDTSLLAVGEDPNITTGILNRDLQKISNWADKWKVTFNPKKSKDMIFSNKTLNNSPPVILNNVFVDRVNCHKHLGIYLSSDLSWSRHIHETCIKAYRKLSVLRSVRLLHRNTLDMLYKLTIRSVIDYGLVIFGTTLNQVDLNRLERVQYRAAKLVTGALHLTSREKLNKELGWETIRTRADFLGLSLFHKIHNGGCRPLISTCLAERNLNKPTSTRNYKTYKNYPNFGVKFSKSFFPYFTNMFCALAPTMSILELSEFKKDLKVSLKPTKFKHFSYGSKLGNKLITRLRVGRSFLNSHSYAVGKANSPQCNVPVMLDRKQVGIIYYSVFSILSNVRTSLIW